MSSLGQHFSQISILEALPHHAANPWFPWYSAIFLFGGLLYTGTTTVTFSTFSLHLFLLQNFIIVFNELICQLIPCETFLDFTRCHITNIQHTGYAPLHFSGAASGWFPGSCPRTWCDCHRIHGDESHWTAHCRPCKVPLCGLNRALTEVIRVGLHGQTINTNSHRLFLLCVVLVILVIAIIASQL